MPAVPLHLRRPQYWQNCSVQDVVQVGRFPASFGKIGPVLELPSLNR